MGIFGLFRKKKIVDEITPPEVILREGIDNWLVGKKKDHSKKEKELIVLIKERISKLNSDLESEIIILQNLNFEIKKETPKVEAIVRENVKNYIKSLEKLMEKLNKVNETKGFVDKINSAINEFNSKTNIAYQKIAYLFEKEIRLTKHHIKIFLDDLALILKSNSKEIEKLKMIELVEENLLNIKKIKKDESNLLGIISKDSLKLKKLKEDSNKGEKEVSRLLQSDEFQKEQDKRKEFELKEQKLSREINSLGASIDFKSLLKFHHKSEKEMKLVKEYKNNFRQTFLQEKENELSKLLAEAKLETPRIIELKKSIKKLQKEVSRFVENDFGIEKMKKNIFRINSDIKLIELEISRDEKKIDNLKVEAEELFQKMVESLKKINVEIAEN